MPNNPNDTPSQLESVDVGKRQQAAKDLGGAKGAQARDLLVSRLEVETEAEVLEWLCWRAQKLLAFGAAPKLLELVAHPVGDVRCAACQALGAVGDDGVTEVLQRVALNDDDIHARLAAIEALGKHGKRHKDKKPQVAQSLAQIADQLGRRENAALRDVGRVANAAVQSVNAEAVEAAIQEPLFAPEELPPIESEDASKAKIFGDLERLIKQSGSAPEVIDYFSGVVTRLRRDQAVVKSRKSEGVTHCELCQTPFFVQKSGNLYCQVAHIEALKDKGRDAIENTLLLCGNCHAQLDMARDTLVTRSENQLHIQLPDGNAATFLLNGGQAPRRI